jgi:hypothetical protein
MSDQVVNTGASALPDDFAEYQAARLGLTVEKEVTEETSGAADSTPPAGTVSDSETEEDLELAEGEDPSGGEEDEEEEDEAPKPKKGKNGFTKRIAKLNARAQQLEAENAELKRLAGVKPAAAADDKTALPVEPNGKPIRPKLSDYGTYEEHETALGEYEERLADWKFEQRSQQSQQQAKQTEAAKAWEDRTAKIRVSHPDYDEKITALQIPNTAAVPVVRDAIAESEIGPEILYHLAQHPEEAKRILSLNPVRAVVELGKLEAKLTPAAAAPKQKTKVTSAPDPISPVGGKGKAGPKPLHEVDDFSEYEKLRRSGAKR